jgi:hypothetical protein
MSTIYWISYNRYPRELFYKHYYTIRFTANVETAKSGEAFSFSLFPYPSLSETLS